MKHKILAILIAMSLLLGLCVTASGTTRNVPGDMDGSGSVNEDDAIYLLQHILMPDLFQLTQNADYDANGSTDEDDAIYLLQHVLMPELFPLAPGGSSEERVRLWVGLPHNDRIADYDNNALTRWVEDTCNVELEFLSYAGNTDMQTQINITIAARQELPDILLGTDFSDAFIRKIGKDGYVLPLTEYFEDRDGASGVFWDRMESELTDEEQNRVMDAIRDPETGRIYSVPAVETCLLGSMRFQPWINQQWLDRLGLQAPTNNEELYRVLVAFRDQDPNGNGRKDEIPLFGSQAAGQGAKVVDWLINLFCYYDSENPYVVDENGKLSPVYTTDAYREALGFVNKLYEEQLLTSVAWTASDSEMRQITMPSSGTSICGIFLGDLRTHVRKGTDQLTDYVPLRTWGCVVRNSITVKKDAFITECCDEPDRAFQVLMALWSWEGSMRVRYGEYGVNWKDADPNAKSPVGMEARYQLIQDPMKQLLQSAQWGVMASSLNAYADGATAQMPDDMDVWQKRMYRLSAECHMILMESGQIYNPDVLCPPLYYTWEEEDAGGTASANISDYWLRSQTMFCTGVWDVHNENDWNAYLRELNIYGLPGWLAINQSAYDRQQSRH